MNPFFFQEENNQSQQLKIFKKSSTSKVNEHINNNTNNNYNKNLNIIKNNTTIKHTNNYSNNNTQQDIINNFLQHSENNISNKRNVSSNQYQIHKSPQSNCSVQYPTFKIPQYNLQNQSLSNTNTPITPTLSSNNYNLNDTNFNNFCLQAPINNEKTSSDTNVCKNFNNKNKDNFNTNANNNIAFINNNNNFQLNNNNNFNLYDFSNLSSNLNLINQLMPQQTQNISNSNSTVKTQSSNNLISNIKSTKPKHSNNHSSGNLPITEEGEVFAFSQEDVSKLEINNYQSQLNSLPYMNKNYPAIYKNWKKDTSSINSKEENALISNEILVKESNSYFYAVKTFTEEDIHKVSNNK